MEVAIKIDHIKKSFGKRQILKDLSFETYCGEVFGFLGPNGAGKTTLIKLITGLLKIDEGSISICGVDLEKDFEGAMKNIGGIVENPECYKYMTGMQNLMQYARMRGDISKERILEVVELVGLSNRINEKVKKYSLGMRQRLGLAQALLHKPKVLILDEPTNGLDPAGIKQLRDILVNISHTENICVFVSSHMMGEMQLMCDRVGIILNGSLLSIQTVDELVSSMDGSNATYTFEVNDTEKSLTLISTNFGNVSLLSKNVNSFEVSVTSVSDEDSTSTDISETIATINALLIQNNIRLYSVSKNQSRSLEDAFIELTKEGGSQIV